MANPRWLQGRREAAWAHGRELCTHLLHRYQDKYALNGPPPPPAIIVPELIRDILGARLFFDPLPDDRYAEVRLNDNLWYVTINSEINQMERVKDPDGVANVAMWHELIHIDCHRDALEIPASLALPGFEEPPAIVCYRAPKETSVRNDVAEREFWAEEAGRAAAVSLEALHRTAPFQELMRKSQASRPVREAWRLLYDSAAAIGVNISALVTQLSLEGFIVVEKEGGANVVLVQPRLRADEGAQWQST